MKKLLIFDEVGKLKFKFFEYLYELWDNIKDIIGIIIVGLEYFYEDLKKWKMKGILGILEFYWWINYWEFLSDLIKEEICGFCEYYNVDFEEVI